MFLGIDIVGLIIYGTEVTMSHLMRVSIFDVRL